MNENDDIEVEYLEAEEVDETLLEPQPKNGVGFIPVVGLSALAAVLGAIGGAFGAQYFVPKPDLSAVQSQIERAVAEAKDESAKEVTALKKTVQTLRKQTIENMDTKKVDVAISKIDKRLGALENAPVLPEINAETLDALKSAQADGLAWPDISPLETQISDMQAEINLLRAKLESVETQPFALNAETVEAVLEEGLLPPQNKDFPVTALMSAAEANTESKGFLARTLNKHVKVREPNDPVVLIEKAANAAEQGDLRSAIKAFDQLPEGIRKAGQDWRNAVGATK